MGAPNIIPRPGSLLWRRGGRSLNPMLSAPDTELAPILENLRARGLEISDRAAALEFLRRVGPYRAQSYWHPLLEKSGGAKSARFVSGASFRHAAALYDFDKSLRFLTLAALEEIEIAVRADVVHRLAARNPWAHRHPEFLRDDFAEPHRKWLARLDADARRPDAETSPHATIWESAERWSFGMLSYLFKWMKVVDRCAIALNYGDPDGGSAADALRVMSGVRNVAAHHGRLWNTSLLTLRPKADLSEKVADFNPPESHIPRTRSYAFLCVIAHFIRCVRPDEDWPGQLRELILKEFPADAPGLSPAQMGFPSGWERHPFWREPAPVGD